MGRGADITTPPNSPWKRPLPPPSPRHLEDLRTPQGDRSAQTSGETKKGLGRTFAESAVGSFIGFDLLSKILDAVVWAVKFGKSRTPVNRQRPRNISGASPVTFGHLVRPSNSSTTSQTAPRRNRFARPSHTIVLPLLASVAMMGALVFFSRQNRQELPRRTVTESTSVDDLAETPKVAQAPPMGFNQDWDEVSRAVVRIEADGAGCGWQGSGTIILDGSYVLTNQHVSGDGQCEIKVWLTDSTSLAPTRFVAADVVVSDAELDLAVIRMFDESGMAFVDPSRTPLTLERRPPALGEKLYLLGYPGSGGSTITFTSGDFAGVDLSEEITYFKTTASMNPGVSGGAALNAEGDLVGIPTAGVGADIVCDKGEECVANGSTIGLLRPSSYAQAIINQISR